MALKNPILSNPIAVDIQKLNEILDALSKANPTDVEGISTGAVRLYEVSSGKWQWQLYNGTSWAPVPFLQHNVDQLDGYHAAITPASNTVAVRNASGVLEDSITGNAATASSAATLSQTLPVNKGGTGATTSEAARANLGVSPTSHASTNTTHGVGNATQYGHLKLSDATNNLSGVSGGVAATPAAVKAAMTRASTLATSSAAGIVKPGTGMTVDADGALNVSLNILSVGALIPSFASSMDGCLLCNGAAVSRTTYAALFAILGTKFGRGDDWTTFNLPDFRDKTFWGANGNLMSIFAAGLPNAYGKVDILSTGGGWDSPSHDYSLFPDSYYESPWLISSGMGMLYHSIRFDLARTNGIYGNSTTVQPPAIAVNIFIKY